MSIADYEFPSKPIAIDPTHSFRVRGLSLHDLTRLMHSHGPALGMIYNRAASLMKTVKDPNTGTTDTIMPTGEEIGELLMTLAQEFPDLIADAIAYAADEPAMAAKVKKFRLPVQIEALYEIVGLTIVGEHEIKKVLEIVTKAAENLTLTINNVTGSKAVSSNGNGAFVSG